jgi:replicative DNA helicase Mcm
MAVQDKHTFSSGELEGRWNTFFEESDLRRKIIQVAEKFPEERSLVVKFVDLDGHDSELADHLLNFPEPTLEAGEKAIQEMLPSIMVISEPIRLRVEGLPPSHRVPIRLLREKHLNKFLAIDGIVRRMTEVRPQIVEAVFECAACRGRVSVPQEIGAQVFKEATKCDSCGKPLGKTRFTLLPEASRYIDSQKIEVQENPEKLKGGSHPEGLTVILSEDLVGHTLPGHRIVINGRLKSLPHPGGSKGYGNQSVFDLILLANSMEKEDREYQEIEITEEDRQAIEAMRGEKDFISRFVDSLAPSIQGMRIEKEAIALQLFGGVAKEQSDGIRVRGDIHVLLVGDPGTGKSQILRYVAEIAPRGIYTSGKGATAAGLTAAAVKDDFGGGRWTLEAGAMVLADMGMICIDELDKMTENDRSSMHEALEQQSYHPDFEIELANGEKQRIGSLVDGLLKANGPRVVLGKDCEILPLQGIRELKVLTTDLKSVMPCVVDRVSRHTAPKHFIRISYANGRVITVTPEHPVFVWKAGQFQTVPASKAAVGEQAPALRPHHKDANVETPSPHVDGGEIPGGESGPFILTKVQKVEIVSNHGIEWVYDVTVEPHHAFVSEGLVLHNTVSVAKAGITSTLRARCPVLAAANPKLGRFTMDKLPAEEIDLPPTLLSRFDVIFAIQDKADREKDRTLAGAILARQVTAEEHEAKKARGSSEPEVSTDESKLFAPEFMRKYIAFAKQNVSPVMEENAYKALLDFYVNLRKQGEGEHKPVPITMRQVEGLVRMTEASARARLSPLATKEDAERAIRIVEHFLRTVVASEGSALDIDYITVGVSTSFRNEISIMREIMRKLQQGTPDGFTTEDVILEAKKRDIKEDKALRLIGELERLNEIFKPRIGIMKLL